MTPQQTRSDPNIDAKRVEDSAIITVTIDRFKNFPAKADPRHVAPAYVRDVLKQAAVELQDKMTELKLSEGNPAIKSRKKPESGGVVMRLDVLKFFIVHTAAGGGPALRRAIPG